MRVRFVGPDGVSFFDEVNDARPSVWKRLVPLPLSFGTTGRYLSTTIETYRRELRHVPIGPMACPVTLTYDPYDKRYNARIDMVYRYEA